LVDRWNSDGEFLLKVNLFPQKVPKTFHKCSTKVFSFIKPPAVMENSEKKYTGFEVYIVELILKRLNLTAEYNVSPNRKINFILGYLQTVSQLDTSSSDIAIGLLPFHPILIDIAEATNPHIQLKFSWYVPCTKSVSRWKTMYRIFVSQVWACFSAVAITAVILMWLLAKYQTKLHVRESRNYKTIIYCIYNVWAVITGVSVPQKPVSLSLRIFFIAWVWYSVAMTTVYQAFFFGLLVNPGFEKSITTLNDLIQTGIEYGYVREIDASSQLSDTLYEIILAIQKTCNSPYKCLQRVIERKGFATIFDNIHAEYFRTRLLFNNIHVPLCTLQEGALRFMLSMYMAKGNPLLNRFNEIITRVFEAGLIEIWWKDFMSSPRLDDHPFDDDDTNFSDFETKELNTDYSTISLIHLQVVFYILLIGQIFSTFVFLVEVLYYRACITAANSTTLYRSHDQ